MVVPSRNNGREETPGQARGGAVGWQTLCHTVPAAELGPWRSQAIQPAGQPDERSEDPGQLLGRAAAGAALPIATSVIDNAVRAVRPMNKRSEDPGQLLGRAAAGAALPIATSVIDNAVRAVRPMNERSEDPGQLFGRAAAGAALPIATSVIDNAVRAVRQ